MKTTKLMLLPMATAAVLALAACNKPADPATTPEATPPADSMSMPAETTPPADAMTPTPAPMEGAPPMDPMAPPADSMAPTDPNAPPATTPPTQ